EIFVFAARSTSSQSNTTHLPSGDGTGAPTRFNAIMSSNVNGCLALGLGDGDWAKSALPTAKLSKCKIFIRLVLFCHSEHSRGIANYFRNIQRCLDFARHDNGACRGACAKRLFHLARCLTQMPLHLFSAIQIA